MPQVDNTQSKWGAFNVNDQNQQPNPPQIAKTDSVGTGWGAAYQQMKASTSFNDVAKP